jgi:ferrous iron transport protein A
MEMSTPRRKHKGGINVFPLGLLASGESGEIAETAMTAGNHVLRHGCCGCGGGGGGCRKESAVRIEDMGIRPGKTVEMLNNEGGGALLVKVDEARIAVARAMAMKIMVRRKDDEPCDA